MAVRAGIQKSRTLKKGAEQLDSSESLEERGNKLGPRRSAFNFFDRKNETDQRSRSIIEIDQKDIGVLNKTFLRLRAAAVISDPVEIQELAEKRMKRIFSYWVGVMILACVLNAVNVYSFLLVPELYSTTELRRIFLTTPYSFNSIVGVTAVIMFTSFYALFVLVFPDETSWRTPNLRWTIFTLLFGYVGLCWFFFITESIGFPERIEDMMRENILFNGTSTVRDESQKYFYCCGVDGYKDWDRIASASERGYPDSCCNRITYPVCAVPLYHKIRLQPDIEVQKFEYLIGIHESGCLSPELLMTGIIITIYLICGALFLFTAVPCCIIMNSTFAQLGGLQYNSETFNPFYD